MAHEFETGFFVGQPAWHGLGVLVKEAPSVSDAIIMAGLDWEVSTKSLFLGDGREVTHRATIRDSDDSILGVVGPAYTPLQNRTAFDWFQPLIESGDVSLEAAGSLKSGRRVWLLGKVNVDPQEIVKGDAVEAYVLLAHAHDGTLAIRVGFTGVRVVCNNTLQWALNQDESGADQSLIKIPHRAHAEKALETARDAMNLATRQFEMTADQFRTLASYGCDDLRLRRYVREVFNPGAADDEKASKQTVGKVAKLFESGRGSELSRGTMWGAYNAVTEFVTHERGRTQDSRLDAQWFGEGAAVTKRALVVANDFVRAAA